MIEKHYGRYIRGDVDEQFSRLLGAKTETFTETFSSEDQETKVSVGNSRDKSWWAHLDSNPFGQETQDRQISY